MTSASVVEAISAGLASGLVATIVMSVPQYFFWRRWGTVGILEWHENQMILSRLLRKEPEKVLLPSFSLHFLNGALAAVGYTLVVWALPSLLSLDAALRGASFGIILWTLTLALIHKPITGISILRHPMGSRPILLSILLHIVYGLVVVATADLIWRT